MSAVNDDGTRGTSLIQQIQQIYDDIDATNYIIVDHNGETVAHERRFTIPESEPKSLKADKRPYYRRFERRSRYD